MTKQNNVIDLTDIKHEALGRALGALFYAEIDASSYPIAETISAEIMVNAGGPATGRIGLVVLWGGESIGLELEPTIARDLANALQEGASYHE